MSSHPSVDSSYLANCLVGLYGRAAAREMASDMYVVDMTVNRGFRFLTGPTNGVSSSAKPYRWMHLRRVDGAELTCLVDKHVRGGPAFKGKGKGRFLESMDPQLLSAWHSESHLLSVWHCCIQDILLRSNSKKPAGIVQSYFLSNIRAVVDDAREKFELLTDHDADDPDSIQAAMADDDFVTALKLYFESGDQLNPKFYKHLATSTQVLEGHTLLTHCCSNGLLDCVRYLLNNHSTKQHATRPWLQLADPLWQDRKWRNSAFSIAANELNPELLQLLLDWAAVDADTVRKGLLVQKDKKGATCMDILAQQLINAYGFGRPDLVVSGERCVRLAYRALGFDAVAQARIAVMAACGSKTWDVIEQVAVNSGVGLLPGASQDAVSATTVGASPAFVLVQVGAAEPHYELFPSRAMTLDRLADTLEGLELRPDSRVLVKGVELMENKDLAGSIRPASLVKASTRLFVAVRGCSCFTFQGFGSAAMHPELWLALSETFLSNLQHDATTRLTAVILDTLLVQASVLSDYYARFTQFLERLLQFFVQSFATGGLNEFTLPANAKAFLVKDRMSLALVVSHVVWLRRVLLAGSDQHTAPKTVWGKLGGVVVPSELSAQPKHNPMLAVVATLERGLLDLKAIAESGAMGSMSDAVLAALHPSWAFYVRSISKVWATLLLEGAIGKFLIEFRIANPSDVALRAPQLIDEAMTFILRMRPKEGCRPGLPTVFTEVLAGVGEAGLQESLSSREVLERCFPGSSDYASRHQLFIE